MQLGEIASIANIYHCTVFTSGSVFIVSTSCVASNGAALCQVLTSSVAMNSIYLIATTFPADSPLPTASSNSLLAIDFSLTLPG